MLSEGRWGDFPHGWGVYLSKTPSGGRCTKLGFANTIPGSKTIVQAQQYNRKALLL